MDFKKCVKNLFSSNDSKFELRISLTVMLVPLVSLMITAYGMWIFLHMVYSYFQANGYSESDLFQETFYDYIFGGLWNYAPLVLAYFTLLFFLGYYIARLLIRPIKQIGEYAEEMIDHEVEPFKMDSVEKRKYILNFSMFFFRRIKQFRVEGEIADTSIPEQFVKVDRPVFDYVFYFQYLLFLFIITMITAIGLWVAADHIYVSITNLALASLNADKSSLMIFLNSMRFVVQSIMVISISLIVFLYFLICNNISTQLNGVTFAFFRIMKQVMSGDLSNRIKLRYADPGHLFADKINFLIDTVAAELVEEETGECSVDEDGDAPPPLPPLPR